MLSIKRFSRVGLGLLFLSVVSQSALADAAKDWPKQPIKLVIPYSAGGPTDGMGRLLAQKMAEKLSQPVIVQNKGGAGGTIGVSEVLRADPDGYTLAMVAPGPVAGMHALTEVPYSQDDIQFITLLARNAAAIGVNVKSGINSLQELIDQAKAKPNQLNFSSAGNGTTPHIGSELFRQEAGLETLHIPYRGTAPATTALLAGEVDYQMTDLSALLPHHQSGTLKVLAVASAERSPHVPDVPTTVELGLPGVIMETNYGLVGPKGIPEPILEKIRITVQEVLQMPEVEKFILDQGGVAQHSTPEEYRDLMFAETKKWKEVARRGNIVLQ